MILFSKTDDPHSKIVKAIIKDLKVNPYKIVDLDTYKSNCAVYENAL